MLQQKDPKGQQKMVQKDHIQDLIDQRAADNLAKLEVG